MSALADLDALLDDVQAAGAPAAGGGGGGGGAADALDSLVADLGKTSVADAAKPAAAGGSGAGGAGGNLATLDSLLQDLGPADGPVKGETVMAVPVPVSAPVAATPVAATASGAAPAPAPVPVSTSSSAAPAPVPVGTEASLDSLLADFSKAGTAPPPAAAEAGGAGGPSLDSLLADFSATTPASKGGQASLGALLDGLSAPPDAAAAAAAKMGSESTSIAPQIESALTARVRGATVVAPKNENLHNYLLRPMEHCKALLAIAAGTQATCQPEKVVSNTVSVINAVADDLALVTTPSVQQDVRDKTVAFGSAAMEVVRLAEGPPSTIFAGAAGRLKAAIAELLSLIRDAATLHATETAATLRANGPGGASAAAAAADEHIIGTPDCAACKRPCTGKYFKVSVKEVYHLECMSCVVCGAPNANYKYGNSLLCENDYKQQAAAAQPSLQSIVCRKCGQPITDRYVEIEGNVWHRQCFACTTCNADLSGGFIEKNGLPFCAQHG